LIFNVILLTINQYIHWKEIFTHVNHFWKLLAQKIKSSNDLFTLYWKYSVWVLLYSKLT
jgi:hypothetical protein